VAATSRAALLHAAIALFAEHGPASVTVRNVADRAGINVALIYRHFGSKDALPAEAIDEGSGVLLPAAWAAPTFDFDAMSHLMHHQSPAPG
jgi:AcrR family transcriptional regulator